MLQTQMSMRMAAKLYSKPKKHISYVSASYIHMGKAYNADHLRIYTRSGEIKACILCVLKCIYTLMFGCT